MKNNQENGVGFCRWLLGGYVYTDEINPLIIAIDPIFILNLTVLRTYQ